ncbi:MAG: hypothetical protein HKN34_01365 [Gammaproteobacteria bacterium]|nr:hypothetical protein [Gammaproteobacteria bacterium]
MTKRLSLLLCTLFFSVSSHAALQVFTDRATWQAAAGGGPGDLFEDFNSFTEDTFYGSQFPAVTAGFLTLDLVDTGPNDSSWLIDVAPDNFASLPNIDGTPYATTIGYQGGHTQADTLMTFGNIRALGFDYKDMSYSVIDGNLTTSLGDSVLRPQNNSPDVFFLGLLYTEGEVFNSLAWEGIFDRGIGFGFSMDNVEAYSAALNPIPVPAAFWLFGTALVGFVGFSRRRKLA